MTTCQERFIVVRFNEAGERLGWCGHRHRYYDKAQSCERSLNRQWGHTGETWLVQTEAPK